MYVVYDVKTELPVATFDKPKECAEWLGVDNIKTFYTHVWRGVKFKRKYIVRKVDDDE